MRMGSEKEDLLLRVAQCLVEMTRNPKSLMEALFNISGVEEFVYVWSPIKKVKKCFDHRKERLICLSVASLIHVGLIR